MNESGRDPPSTTAVYNAMLLSNFRATPLVAKSLSLCLSFPLGFELVFLRQIRLETRANLFTHDLKMLVPWISRCLDLV